MSVFTWIADRALGWRQRAGEVRAEIAEHDAKAGEVQTDLDRYTADHARKVEQAQAQIVNTLAASGHLYSGTMRTQLEHVLEDAQEQFRNEASGKVRVFRSLAMAEGAEHARRRKGPGPTLVLSEEARDAVASWCERPYPIPNTGEEPLRPRNLLESDEEIAPLLDPAGLTWEDARAGSGR